MTTQEWNTKSWREKVALQQPIYNDIALLESVEKQLSKYPPLVFAGEAESLKKHLAKVSRGEAFCYKVEIVQRAFLTLML